MNGVRWPLRLLVFVAVAAAASARPTTGESPAQGAAILSDIAPLTANLVKTGLFEVAGGGANSLLRFSASGLIVVDGKAAGNYQPLMSQVRRISRISDLPVQFLILTNHLADRSATNAQFAEKGVRIIAHENAARRLGKGRSGTDPLGVPSLTYKTRHPLRVGGIEIQLYHFGNARTDGDTVVHFVNLKVVAVGDLFAAQPNPDFSSGGSLLGWPAVLEQILKLDFDTVVPSTGPSVGRKELEAFTTSIERVVSRATALVKRGVPKDQLMAQLKTADLGWTFTFSGAQLDAFYSELSPAAK